MSSYFFFFNDTATTEIYTLSLHDALPILQFGVGLTDATPGSARTTYLVVTDIEAVHRELTERGLAVRDRKSTRLNSSHGYISYAVFCLKKKKKQDSESSL